MRRKIFALLLAASLLPISASYAAESLPLDSCVQRALSNHPDLAASQAAVESSEATIEQEKSANRPQISLSSSYTRAENNSSSNSNSSSNYKPRSGGSYGEYSTDLTIQQQLTDWGKTKARVKKAQFTTQASREDLRQQADEVISTVRDAYYSLNSAERQNAVAKTRYKNYADRLDWAKSYYEVGTKAKIEVTRAEADLASSKLDLIKTESETEQAKASLATAIGEPKNKIEAAEDVLEYEDWNISEEQAIEQAIANRPELAAKKARVEAARANLTIEKKGLSPEAYISGGYNYSGSAPFDDHQWSARASLSIPIYDGSLTKANIAQAEADCRTAEAEYTSIENDVILEVRKAWQEMREAKEAIVAAREAERSQQENFDLSAARYKAGVGDSLEISDAIENLASAQNETISSLHQSKSAQLALRKAIGGLSE